MDSLANDVITCELLKYLECIDTFKFSMTCKRMRKLSRDERIKRLHKRMLADLLVKTRFISLDLNKYPIYGERTIHTDLILLSNWSIKRIRTRKETIITVRQIHCNVYAPNNVIMSVDNIIGYWVVWEGRNVFRKEGFPFKDAERTNMYID